MAIVPKSTVVGATGASGAAGFTACVAALNTAVAAAISTATGTTGYIANSLGIAPATCNVDTDSHLINMTQTLTYTIINS